MANFRVWIEKTRRGTFQVRHEDKDGNRGTDYSVEKHEAATVDGRRVTGKTLAKALAEKVRNQHYSNVLGAIDTSLSVEDLAETYCNHLASSQYSRNYVIHSEGAIKFFIRDLKLKTLADITHEKIETWKDDMLAGGYMASTVQGRLQDVRAFLSWLVRKEKIKTNPFGKGLMPRRYPSTPKFYTAAEWKALDAALEAGNSLFTRLVCHLAKSAGLRLAEAAGEFGNKGLLMEDIEWLPDGAICIHLRSEVVKGKRRARIIPVAAGDPVIPLLGSRRSGPVIEITRGGIYHHYEIAKARSQINPKLNIHGLRHTFAKDYLQAGGNLKALKDLLGHASTTTTEIYSQFEQSHYAEGMQRSLERRLREEKLSEKMPVVQAVGIL